ncbi:hypothetical protein BCR34DRAFT_648615 [Clohesyomyces aquaticus]|uniref:BZIP domain-containing protein n=1 Tax=Clohesyomyces aquaticus TaxID=1231657 RepID=A0A1Y1ZTN1_9PLEO|nr:hypothetical protein BCR34DRAFT_648615 [Clohesyomyces aquaticus]
MSGRESDSAAPPPKKKYQRSQSPRAVERRKIQNRIAQRNHRRRLKEQEQSAASGEDNSDSGEISTFLPYDWTTASSMDAMMASMDTMEDMSFASEPGWGPIDPMLLIDPMLSNMNLPSGDVFASHDTPFVFPFPEGCTCSAMTGPCSRHLDEIRFQLSLNAMGSPSANMMPTAATPPNPQGLASPALSAVDLKNSPSPFCLDGTTPSQQKTPSLHQSIHKSSISSPTSAHSFRVEKKPKGRRRSSTTSSVKISTPPSTTGSTPSDPASTPATKYTTSPMSTTTTTIDVDPATRNTSRFNGILSTVREAGFADFDSMVSTYYTCSFTKSSVPEMAQRASRSRRLPRLVQNLHASSKAWPRWEARGFRNAATENAKIVYEEEITRVARHLDKSASMNGEGDALSALHQLRASGKMDKTEQVRLMALLTTLPEDIEMAVQDEAPHLWSLFTELAGTQSLYCDRVSQAVLALLINGRRSQWKN